MSALFLACFAVVIGAEGGFTANPADPGNWTGGAVQVGRLLGTKYGISAASYPNLDIEALTLSQAQALYEQDYWTPVQGDHLAAPLAMLMFDAAVNAGVPRAVRWLQEALGVTEDGIFGPETLKGANAVPIVWVLCAEVLARRIDSTALLPTWRSFGLGWARRLARLPWEAMRLE
jgi:lysozyme family protein